MVKTDVRQFRSDKILKHLDRVSAWLKGENPPPITVELDMTNVCNHRCRECARNYFRRPNKDTLPISLARDIIGQLARAGIRGLIFTGGGEPLCHPDTPHAVAYARSLGLDVGFITNGSLLDRRAGEVLLSTCTWIRVSLDAASPGIFRLTHGMDGAEFRNVIEKIELLVRVKKETGSRCTVGVGYLTSSKTAAGMLDAARLGVELGVDYLQYRPMQMRVNGKRGYEGVDVSRSIAEAIKFSDGRYRVLFSKHKYDMMGHENLGRTYGACYGHQFATVVSASGKMYLCCHMRGHDKYCLGDHKQDSFEVIWNSEKRKRVVDRINFVDCVPLCRCNTFNQILWDLKEPREHENFL